jgi:hypothetical protein
VDIPVVQNAQLGLISTFLLVPFLILSLPRAAGLSPGRTKALVRASTVPETDQRASARIAVNTAFITIAILS